MRIVYSYQGKALVFNRETDQVIIGRPREGIVPDLDLTPDQTVLRPHARLLSPEVHAHVWRVVQAEPTTIATKHEGDLQAYRIERLKT
jgi:hypothetical protein